MERRERTIPGSLEQMQEYRMQVAQAASAAAEVRALRPLLLAAARATPHMRLLFLRVARYLPIARLRPSGWGTSTERCRFTSNA